jgi:lipid II:glycine glycyltransferase (peptidoglycan interpeptide bridge formation enzyme)
VSAGGSVPSGVPGHVPLAGSPPGSSPGVADVAAPRDVDAEWNDFVASTPLAPYLQATPWATVKARNGWAARRIVTGRTGGQLLTHPIGPLPWSVGYVPRGPISPDLDRSGVRDWTVALRGVAREARLSHVVIDPEIEAGGPELAWFRDAGWRPCPSPQPARSRWIDLGRSEDELWGDLRGKWRQYVQKARRAGVRIVDAGPDRLGDFYAIYVETARRAGFTYRTEATYRATFDAYAAHGKARLLFADGPDGRPEATLMLIGWGGRVVEPYGGMTRAGAESRANYLLKWEAIRSSRGAGYTTYDLWGLSHAGIEHFKVGFGGREVEYIGGLELPIRPLVRSAVQVVQAGRVILARRRLHGERPVTAEGAEP